jgi:uncharacterized protein (DUF1697 family)
MAPSKAAFAHLALLRGINVGGKNKLAMKDLIQLFTEAGCSDVQTYIQSGNVLFNAPRTRVKGLADGITKSIQNLIGCRIPVVLRTAEELGEAIRNNPFANEGVPESTLHVYFLRAVPDKRDVAALDANRSLPDTFKVCGREIYVQLPNGMARTKLTNAYFDFKLSTISTARNWNTVRKLDELMRG